MSASRLNGTTKAPSSNGRDGATARPAPAEPAAHDARTGRFLPGNAGGGNPYARHAARLKHALLQAVEDADSVRRVVQSLTRRVERHGDLGAARLLLRYALGRPVETCEPDAVDRDEVVRAAGVPLVSLLQVDSVTPAAALALAKILRRLGLQLAVSGPAGQLVGLDGWNKVFEEFNDPELLEWWREQVEGRLDEAMAAGGKVGTIGKKG
jgi:hypothetical protein